MPTDSFTPNPLNYLFSLRENINLFENWKPKNGEKAPVKYKSIMGRVFFA